MIPHTFWGTFVFYGKVAGSIISLGVLISFVYSKMISPVVRKVVDINETVTALAKNHLPHIQASLNAQDTVLAEVKKDVQQSKEKITQYGEGLAETKQTVHMLHSTLLNHLENTSAEKAKKKKRHARS
jgi:ribosomal protein L7/L12